MNSMALTSSSKMVLGMALDAYFETCLDSNNQLAGPLVVPSWVAGGIPQSTISNSFFQKDGQSLSCIGLLICVIPLLHMQLSTVLVWGTGTQLTR